MSDAFNDDLSADMNDPTFAAEFERTTDEVRRERYAAAIAAADDMRKDWCYAEADAAMALADEEQREFREMMTRILEKANERNARLRAELEKTHAQGSGAIHPFADEGSASLFMEAAALRGQAASLKAENKRLHAELAESRRKECDALCSDVDRDRDEYEATISRVRAVLDEWYGTSDASALSAEIRTALSGESS